MACLRGAAAPKTPLNCTRRSEKKRLIDLNSFHETWFKNIRQNCDFVNKKSWNFFRGGAFTSSPPTYGQTKHVNFFNQKKGQQRYKYNARISGITSSQLSSIWRNPQYDKWHRGVCREALGYAPLFLIINFRKALPPPPDHSILRIPL